MPVIGRLDGQVDEVIIKPISERRRGEDESRGEDSPADADDASGARRDSHAPPTPVPTQTPTDGESSADADELPVWLL